MPGILPGQNTPQQQQRKAASLPASFALFPGFARASSPCQRSRQWIQKKGRECVNTPRPAGQSPDGIIASARHDQVFRPCKRLQLLQGQTVIYGLTSRQTGPPRRQPRFPQQRQAGTAPYGHPPLPENCPVENLSYPGSSGNRDVAGGLGAAPPVMRTGGAVASPRRNKPLRKSGLKRPAFLPSLAAA